MIIVAKAWLNRRDAKANWAWGRAAVRLTRHYKVIDRLLGRRATGRAFRDRFHTLLGKTSGRDQLDLQRRILSKMMRELRAQERREAASVEAMTTTGSQVIGKEEPKRLSEPSSASEP